MSDAVISELTLTCAPGSNEQILWAAPTFVARNHSDVATYSGVATFANIGSTEEYNFYDIITATLGGIPVVLGDNGVSITLRNGAKKVGQSSGIAQTFALPRYEVEITMQILWDSTARTAMANAKTGTSMALVLTWGSAGAVGYLNFAVNAAFNQAVNLEHALEGNFVTLNMTAIGTYGSTVPITITQVTNNDRAW